MAVCLSVISTVHATTGCNAVGWDDRHTDVQGCTLYYSAIEWLYSQGIARGVNDPQNPKLQLYQPDRAVNRAEFTKLVLLASGVIDPPAPCTSNPFPDVPKPHGLLRTCALQKRRGLSVVFPMERLSQASISTLRMAQKSSQKLLSSL